MPTTCGRIARWTGLLPATQRALHRQSAHQLPVDRSACWCTCCSAALKPLGTNRTDCALGRAFACYPARAIQTERASATGRQVGLLVYVLFGGS
jgi:hypothetical protein